jgi:hypothetical protein
VEAGRAKARAEIAEYLGPEELRGPPTAEEWAEVRAARRRAAEAPDVELATLVQPLPTGPWDPEDLAFFERCLQLVRDGDGEGATDLAAAISGNPDRDLFAHFPLLLARAPKHCRGMIRTYRRDVAEQLGIELVPIVKAPSDAKADGTDGTDGDDDDDDDDVQWMDEPDE